MTDKPILDMDGWTVDYFQKTLQELAKLSLRPAREILQRSLTDALMQAWNLGLWKPKVPELPKTILRPQVYGPNLLNQSCKLP